MNNQALCPICLGSIYSTTYRGQNAYKCNNSNDCPSSNEVVGRTKRQVRMAMEELDRRTATVEDYVDIEKDILKNYPEIDHAEEREIRTDGGHTIGKNGGEVAHLPIDEQTERLRSLPIQGLRKAASRADLRTEGSCEEIARRLAENGAFLGKIGDSTVYLKEDDGSRVLIQRKTRWGDGSWK